MKSSASAKYYSILYTAALLWSCCFVMGCENTQKEIDIWTKDKVMQEEATDIESYMSQDGKMKAMLKAPLMIRVLGRSAGDTQFVEFPKKLHVDFFDDSTKIESYLDSKYGKYFENLNKVYLRDSVVVVTLKGDTLRCHDLWWDQNRELFYTDSVATYRSPGNDLSGGKGMEATQDLKTVRFREPIGTIQTNESGFAQ
jgi:LPS export ABC transporter protein LptC